jgi:GWxTD domain-containing protein
MKPSKNKIILILFVIFIATIVFSCYPYQQSSQSTHKNLAYIYNPNAVTLHPQYSVYHVNNETSELNVKILKNELFFIKSPASTAKYSNIKVKYVIYNSYKSKQIVDTSTINFDFVYSLTKDTIELTIPIKIKNDSTYSAIVELIDLNRERTETNYFFIDKRWFSIENFKFIKLSNNQIVNENWIEQNAKYKIETSVHKTKKIYASYYKMQFNKALQPYSTNKEKIILTKPDTMFLLTDTINLTENGLYLLRTDTTRKNGAFLNVFSKNYPNITTPVELLNKISYLTSTSEYNQIVENDNKKIALDKYWLNLTGSSSRAKDLIRIYYTRVKLANKYFTSYKEGWKTDKGIIYIIYGDPTIVYKSDDLEKWIYGENQENAGLVFLFERKKDELFNNNYELIRNPDYKTIWFQAIDTWRSGRAFAIVN